MTNAQIHNLARQMVIDGRATNLMTATHQILAYINAHATAYYRATLPQNDR